MKLWFQIMFALCYGLVSVALVMTSLAAGAFFWAEKFGQPIGGLIGAAQFLIGLGMASAGIVIGNKYL